MEDKMDRLKGKVILISGGARGQGAAEARLFVAEGARVVIGDVLEPEGHQLASELGNAAAFVRQDVMQERDWETAVNAAEKLGGLHGLVNNAGIYPPRTLMETDTELFERHTRVNQLGCFLGNQTMNRSWAAAAPPSVIGGTGLGFHPAPTSSCPRRSPSQQTILVRARPAAHPAQTCTSGGGRTFVVSRLRVTVLNIAG
jgi:NAD(P)-dependent dehydrogenase (short-subunit alcohol dehydrogenase family)